MKVVGWFFCVFSLCCMTCLSAGDLLAAQSSADALVDSAKKEDARKKVGGLVQAPGVDKEYVIGIGDILHVSIYGEGDMAASAPPAGSRAQQGTAANEGDTLRRPGGGVEVRLDGRISLQHVGDVQVVGMTLPQLADYLKDLYSTAFSNPIVTAVLLQSNSRRYTVMGQVAQPGVFYLDYPLTIVQAIARSGGFTEWAKHDVTVVRQGDGQAGGSGDGSAVRFDYDDFLNGKDFDKNVFINPGDVVVVH